MGEEDFGGVLKVGSRKWRIIKMKIKKDLAHQLAEEVLKLEKGKWEGSFFKLVDLAEDLLKEDKKHFCDWSGNCYDKEGCSICKKVSK